MGSNTHPFNYKLLSTLNGYYPLLKTKVFGTSVGMWKKMSKKEKFRLDSARNGQKS